MPIPVYTYWRLIRWLGPWSSGERAPSAVSRRRIRIAANHSDCNPIEALVYAPTDRAPIGSYLISHGLHPHGPDETRCDRFARVLAHCGFIVMCPRLSALTQMRLDATAIDELSRSLEALTALPEHPRRKRPGIFSISFGSYPALMTAASPHVSHLVGSLIVFGGYGSFVDTCRFMIGAGPADARAPAPDPTCMAGLAINTAAALFHGEQQHRLIHAWRAFVTRVWGASDMQHEQIAEAANEIAADLPLEIRPMFLQGCGLAPGFGAWVEEGLARTDVQTMDARAHLHNVRCPVHLFHGRRDNVIPYSQMTVLAAALSKVDPKTYLTGLYEHGRRDTNALRQLPTLVREIGTMAAMVHAVVLSGTRSA